MCYGSSFGIFQEALHLSELMCCLHRVISVEPKNLLLKRFVRVVRTFCTKPSTWPPASESAKRRETRYNENRPASSSAIVAVYRATCYDILQQPRKESKKQHFHNMTYRSRGRSLVEVILVSMPNANVPRFRG
jgi:hypothetical protein